jgi:hypothetical protein
MTEPDDDLKSRLHEAIADAEGWTAEPFKPIFESDPFDLDILLSEYRFTELTRFFANFDGLTDSSLEAEATLWAGLVAVRDGVRTVPVTDKRAEPVSLEAIEAEYPLGAEDEDGDWIPDDVVHRHRVDFCGEHLRRQLSVLEEQKYSLLSAAGGGDRSSVPMLAWRIQETVEVMRRTRALWMRHLAYCWPPGLGHDPEDMASAYDEPNAFAPFMDAA